MNVFNLNNYTTETEEKFIQTYAEKYVETLNKTMGLPNLEAMSTPQRNRDVYRWWSYDQLRSSPPESWNTWSSEAPSLNYVFSDLEHKIGAKVKATMDYYGVPEASAKQLVKGFLGYHPSYGAYICSIGPYYSEGFWFGPAHRHAEADDKFNFYIIRRAIARPEEIGRTVAENIVKWQRAFGIEFEPEDMNLEVKRSPAFEISRQKQRDKEILQTINLNPENPAARSFYENSAVMGLGSSITLNSNGYVKMLRQLLGPWFDETLRELEASGRSSEEIMRQLYTDKALLKQVYTAAYKKWKEASARGEAVALGIQKCPKFLDASLSVESGQQGFTEARPNLALERKLRFRSEVARALQSGMTDPVEIANALNNDPQRAVRIERNRRGRSSGEQAPQQTQVETITVTPEEVSRHLDVINTQTQNKEIGLVVQDTIAAADGAKTGRGYDDMRTAFEMAALHFSALPVDPLTKSVMGTPTHMTFDPPEDFVNYTRDDLLRLKAEKIARIEREQGNPTASPEQIQREIAGEMPAAERTPAETEVVTPSPVSEVAQNVPAPTEEPSEETPSGGLMSNLEDMFATTVNNLIKIAAELDADNKDAEAEEVHKVIRKYMRGQK
jgi:hypothetical protein